MNCLSRVRNKKKHDHRPGKLLRLSVPRDNNAIFFIADDCARIALFRNSVTRSLRLPYSIVIDRARTLINTFHSFTVITNSIS